MNKEVRVNKFALPKIVVWTLSWLLVVSCASLSLQAQTSRQISSRRPQTNVSKDVDFSTNSKSKRSLLTELTDRLDETNKNSKNQQFRKTKARQRARKNERDSAGNRVIAEPVNEQYSTAVSVIESNTSNFGTMNSGAIETGVQQQSEPSESILVKKSQSKVRVAQVVGPQTIESVTEHRRKPTDLLLNSITQHELRSQFSKQSLAPIHEMNDQSSKTNVFNTRSKSRVEKPVPNESAMKADSPMTMPDRMMISLSSQTGLESAELNLLDDQIESNPTSTVASNRGLAFASPPTTLFLGESRKPDSELANEEMIDDIEIDAGSDSTNPEVQQPISLSTMKSALSASNTPLDHSPGIINVSARHGVYSNMTDDSENFNADRSQLRHDAIQQLKLIESEEFSRQPLSDDDAGLNGPAKPSDMWLNNKSRYNWSTINKQPRPALDKNGNDKNENAVDDSAIKWVRSTRPGSFGTNRNRAIQITFGDQDQQQDSQEALKPDSFEQDGLELTDQDSGQYEEELLEDDINQYDEDNQDTAAAAAEKINIQRAEYVDDLHQKLSSAPALLALNYVDDEGEQIPVSPERKNYLIDFGGFYQNACLPSVGRTDAFNCLWQPKCAVWISPNFCHQPLYYEEVNLERFGGRFPFVQPAISGLHFFSSTIRLPYQVVLDPPWECIYTAGYGRPGNKYCLQRKKFVWDTKAGSFQALLATAVVFGLP